MSRRLRIHRVTDVAGRDRFYLPPQGGYGWAWLEPAEVPPFSGDTAVMEAERVQGRWLVLTA